MLEITKELLISKLNDLFEKILALLRSINIPYDNAKGKPKEYIE